MDCRSHDLFAIGISVRFARCLGRSNLNDKDNDSLCLDTYAKLLLKTSLAAGSATIAALKLAELSAKLSVAPSATILMESFS
ncbi:hypothetical protein D3C76_1585400 [compost metagenome]